MSTHVNVHMGGELNIYLVDFAGAAQITFSDRRTPAQWTVRFVNLGRDQALTALLAALREAELADVTMDGKSWDFKSGMNIQVYEEEPFGLWNFSDGVIRWVEVSKGITLYLSSVTGVRIHLGGDR